jgi:hypothetical protein
VLLTALKIVAAVWLGLLVVGVAVLAILYVFDMVARAIRRTFARRRGIP